MLIFNSRTVAHISMCAIVISVDGRDFSLCVFDPDHIWMQNISHVFDLASLLVANSEYFWSTSGITHIQYR